MDLAELEKARKASNETTDLLISAAKFFWCVAVLVLLAIIAFG